MPPPQPAPFAGRLHPRHVLLKRAPIVALLALVLVGAAQKVARRRRVRGARGRVGERVRCDEDEKKTITNNASCRIERVSEKNKCKYL